MDGCLGILKRVSYGWMGGWVFRRAIVVEVEEREVLWRGIQMIDGSRVGAWLAGCVSGWASKGGCVGGGRVLVSPVFPHCGDAQQWSCGRHCVAAFVHERQVVAAATPLIMKTPLCIVAAWGRREGGRETGEEELRWRRGRGREGSRGEQRGEKGEGSNDAGVRKRERWVWKEEGFKCKRNE